MTDPKHPALLAAERWFDTDQTRSDLATSARCLVKGWVDDRPALLTQPIGAPARLVTPAPSPLRSRAVMTRTTDT